MNYLIDTNIILDIALERMLFIEDSVQIFLIKETNNINLFISASSVTDVYFIIKKIKGHQVAISFLKDLFQVCFISKVDDNNIFEAINSEIKDFEDAVQVSVAKNFNANGIITRNSKDFIKSGITIFTPKEFISKYKH